MAPAAPPGPAGSPHWWGTLLYIPALYLAGFALSRPFGWLQPSWRPDQVDLAGVLIAFALLLLTLPWRLHRVWGSLTPWASLGLQVPRARGVRSGLLGLAKAAALLAFVSLGLLLSHQARWAGVWPAAPRLLNVLAWGCWGCAWRWSVGLAVAPSGERQPCMGDSLVAGSCCRAGCWRFLPGRRAGGPGPARGR